MLAQSPAQWRWYIAGVPCRHRKTVAQLDSLGERRARLVATQRRPDTGPVRRSLAAIASCMLTASLSGAMLLSPTRSWLARLLSAGGLLRLLARARSKWL